MNKQLSDVSVVEDVLADLRKTPKRLPSKYFYDHRGSQLFNEICALDEYYLTRSEQWIMDAYAGEIGTQIGSRVMLVEYGSGSSMKTRTLLRHLESPAAYVPVDISEEHLHATAESLGADFPHLEILPVAADFTQPFALPSSTQAPSRVVVYFSGSTIGNFSCDEALRLLRQIARMCGTGGGLLIGIDLQKPIDVIHAAYNDAGGVTAEFNRNILHHLNRELDANFVVEGYEHRAVYNEDADRIEMYLVSQSDQTVTVEDETFRIARGEAILTEYSHKYTIEGFSALASRAGLTLRESWSDPQDFFAVLHLSILD